MILGDTGPSGRKRLGVVGTLVWDTIHQRDGRTVPVAEWGGVAYALAGLSAALSEEWEIVPLLKIGGDLSEEALRFLRSFPRVDMQTGIRIVPEANNKVELRYLNDERRTERLSGGVPPWNWPELAPLAATCDALYVNFISGFEMDLDAARALRVGFDGPSYADLHSLFMGIDPRGLRVPQELPAWGAWLRCFDAVQMNEDEFELLGRAWGDPWHLAADLVGPELKLIAVTLGPKGAAYVAGPGFSSEPLDWPAQRKGVGQPGPTTSARIPVAEGAETGDPTGCGDVWGATLFATLLSGSPLDQAMQQANRQAARNVRHRGARGLRDHLMGRLSERMP